MTPSRLASLALLTALSLASAALLPTGVAAQTGGRIAVKPGAATSGRPKPPAIGRNTCIDATKIAGAELYSDWGIVLTMKNHRRYRMFFARECPEMSFYQGFYYKRTRSGQLCAGRDSVGARSGGECPIASILPVRIR